MSRPDHVESFIQSLLPIAKKVRETYGVPISVCIAQAGLESGWNFSNKSMFGVAIGGNPSKGFVKYATAEDAAMAYGKNLRYNKVYANAWAFQNDPDKFIDAIAERYAPKQNYAATVKKIMNSFDLKDYDTEMLFTPSGVAPAGN
jgi:flagellum-specific peptidoglycan hydrolase FlgJ